MNKDLRHAMLLLSRGITLDKLDYGADMWKWSDMRRETTRGFMEQLSKPEKPEIVERFHVVARDGDYSL